MRIKKYLKIVGLVLFVYILFQINIEELSLAIRGINFFYFFVALTLWVFAFILRVLRWKILIDSQDIKVPLKSIFEMSLKGLYLGTITPAKLGEFWKAKYLAENSKISNGRAFYTTLMDRIIDLIIIITISLVSIIVLFLLYKMEIGWMAIILILILIALMIYFLTKKEDTKKTLKFLIKFFLPQSMGKKIDLFFDDFFEGLKKINPILFLKLIGYGLGYYLTAILVYYSISLSLGIFVPFWYLFLIVAFVWLVLTLPITILGLGTREASYIFFFSILGISSFQAVAFSLLLLFCNVLLAIPGAVLIFKNKN